MLSIESDSDVAFHQSACKSGLSQYASIPPQKWKHTENVMIIVYTILIFFGYI